MAANSASPGTGLWTAVTSGTITSPTSPTTTITGLIIAGSYNFVWTITNGSCVSSDTVLITVSAAILPDAGLDFHRCNTFTANLNANDPAPGIGAWTSPSGATVTFPNMSSTTVSNMVLGNNVFVWTITSGSCVAYDTIHVFVDSVIIANAGIDHSICADSTSVLLGVNPAPGTGTWTTTSLANISTPTLANSIVTNMNAVGSYMFIWTVVNGVCLSRDTAYVNVDSLIIADAGSDEQLCETFTTTLKANSVTPGLGTWSTLGAATFVDVNDPMTMVNNLAYGANVFIWSVTNGTCISVDTVIVYNDSVIVSNAGADLAICSSASQVILAANDPLPGLGVWTTATTAVFADSSQASTTASGFIITGSYELIWTIENGTCIASDTVVITVDSNAIANAGADQHLCETISSVTLSATTATIGVGVWSTSGSSTITDINDPATAVSGLAIGDNIFVWTLTSGACVTTDTVDVVISQQPDSANAGTDQLVCASLSLASISGNTPSFGTISWTSLGSAIVDFASSVTTTVSNLSLGSNLFVYTISNGACSSTDTVAVNMFANPIADAGADQFTSSGTPVIIGGTPSASGGTSPYTYNWNPGVVLDDSLIANPTAVIAVTTTFTLTITDSLGCNAQDLVTVWINSPPILQNDTLIINEDSTVVIFPLLNDTDPDNNLNLGTLAILSGPYNGTATVDTLTGTITYIPNANFYGQDSIMYTICDSGMPVYCDTAWIYITINPINDAPLAVDDFGATVEDSCIQIAVLANDSDVENAIIIGSLVTFNGPSHGTLSLDTLTGIITYCPDSNFAGVDTFYYAICDSGYPAPGLCDTAMVVITVNPINDLPIAMNDTVALCSNDSVLVNVMSNDVDVDGDPLSVSVSIAPNHGLASVDIAQNILYVPDILYNGIDSLQYIICDNQLPAGCDTAWVFIDVRGVPVLSSVTTGNKCFGDSLGSIDLSISGNSGFTILWNTGSMVEDQDSLWTGIYTVAVTDTFGCISTLVDTIVGPASPLVGVLSLQPVFCHADSSGAIDLQPSGGTVPYYFSWSNGSIAEDIDSLIAGVYSVILSDTNGCQIILTDTITQPDSALAASMVVTNVKCGGDSTGSISVIPTGGTATYSYLWNNGAVIDSLIAIPAGVYSVVITDSHNCLLSISDTVMDINPAIVLDSIVVQPYCLGGILGSVEVIPSGGISPFQYGWSTGDTIAILDSLSSGTYSVLVTDSIGCSRSFSTVLNDTSQINIQVVGSTIFCTGDSVILIATNSTLASYQWSNNGVPMADTLNALIIYTGGNYSVDVTSVCGPFTAGPITVIENTLPIAGVDPDMTVPCDSTITLTATGGNTYLWSPANLVSDIHSAVVTVNLQQTASLVVTATSAEGCSSNDTVVITVVCDTLFIPSGFSPNGDGVNDFFEISAINRYPDAVLKIFNRWGDLVYSKEHYDNSWNGFSNTDMIRMGEILPNGTYYYVFKPGNGDDNQAGYVILRR